MKSAFEYSGNKLIYHWRESTGAAVFLSVFALIWNAISLSATYAVITGNGISINDVPYTSLRDAFDQNPIILIFLPFPLVGLAFGYAALCCWLNQTTFTSDGTLLTKKTSPLPVPGDIVLERSSITNVFVKKGLTPKSNPMNKSFVVGLTLVDGKEIEIHKAGIDLESATVLEKWIKERMNLT